MQVHYPTEEEWATLRKFGLTTMGTSIVVRPDMQDKLEKMGLSKDDVAELAETPPTDYIVAAPDVGVVPVASDQHILVTAAAKE